MQNLEKRLRVLDNLTPLYFIPGSRGRIHKTDQDQDQSFWLKIRIEIKIGIHEVVKLIFRLKIRINFNPRE